MEVLIINNKQKEERSKHEYGCVCPNCGSVFIFDDMDISRPKCFNYTLNKCNVKCPNESCGCVIKMDNKCITKFKTKSDKDEFEMIYNG